jgi:hypothetical protein
MPHPKDISAVCTDQEMWTPQQISNVFSTAQKPWMAKIGYQII